MRSIIYESWSARTIRPADDLEGAKEMIWQMWHKNALFIITVKPVCNDHLYNKIYNLWFIQ